MNFGEIVVGAVVGFILGAWLVGDSLYAGRKKEIAAGGFEQGGQLYRITPMEPRP